MTTGQKIKMFRKALGLTQEELGAAIGVQKAAINKYEVGKVVNLKQSTLSALAKALHVTPSELLDDDEIVSPGPAKPELEIKEGVLPLIRGLNKLTPEQIQQVTAVFEAMFKQTIPDLFKEGDENNGPGL